MPDASQFLATVLAQHHPALGVFIPAGLHPPAAERRHIDALTRAGSGLIEIGLPSHSAPLDGPVIRAAYHQALRQGTDLARTLRAVEHAAGRAPTVVMAYWEPVQHEGPERLARACAAAGAAGVMVVDLPAYMAGRWRDATQDAGLCAPRLVPRHTSRPGLPSATAGASGWLYAPASTATTGYQGALDIPALGAFIQRLRASSPLPVVSGVGISTPGLAARVAPLVDAVVIGTPIVRALATDPAQAPSLIASFARALHPTSTTETRA
ncbi:tryptophan synthase subunit alpha [Streptomyces sp. A5-4]|uniref:tryptophan synthase subunit alpha n=1 Tax=Streptomyces sp. A5-4 TaxID=3384771 RepID=UPI003DA87552